MDEESCLGGGQIISDASDCHGASDVGTVRTDPWHLPYEK